MKLVAIDSFGRDEVTDILIAENVAEHDAQVMADAWNAHYLWDGKDTYCVVKEDDYRLSKGMEDLI